MFKKLKIGTKIILLVSVIIITLTASIATITLFEARNAMEIQVANSLQNTLEQKQIRIKTFFLTNEQKISSLFNLPEIKAYVSNPGSNDLEREINNAIDLIKQGPPLRVYIFNKEGDRIFSNSLRPIKEIIKNDKSILTKIKENKRKYGDIVNHSNSLKTFLYRKIEGTDALVAIEINLAPVIDLLDDKNGIGETGEYLIAQHSSKGLRFINKLRKDSVKRFLKEIPNDPNTAVPMRKAVAGKTESGTGVDYAGDKVISAWSPLKPELNLGIVAKQDAKEAFSSIDQLTFIVISVSVLAVLIGIAIILLFAKTISTPLIQLQKVFKELAIGKLLEKLIKTRRKDEIGSMIHSVNDLVSYQGKIVNYAQRVGNGDFSVASEIKEDSGDLSKALLNMTLSLKEASEKEELRNWSIKGLAKFSDILRGNNDDMLALGFSIISNLVNYPEVNQGGLFVIHEKEDGEQVLMLNGYYAYNREKFLEKEVIPGEGLVGQCFLEQERIHLTEVPNEYVSVTSGLGEATPESLLLIPLKVNDEVYGVIELASFSNFENYHIEFVEKLGESIASTISSVKVAEKTKKLLDESTGMSDALQSQEEQLRQTMEEMQDTQEEMSLNESYLQSHKSALASSSMLCEISLDGLIKNANNNLFDKTGFSSEELIGKDISLLKSATASKADFDELLSVIESAVSVSKQLDINNKRGKAIETIATFSPISNNGVVTGLICAFQDISSFINIQEVAPMPVAESNPVNSDELEKLKEKIAKQREKIRELKSQSKNDNSKELVALEKENAELKEKLNKSSDSPSNLSDSENLAVQLEQATSLLQSITSEKDAEIQALNDQLEQAKGLIESMNSAGESTSDNEDIKALSEKHQEKEKQVEELLTKVNDLSKSLATTIEEKERMDILLGEAQKSLKDSGKSNVKRDPLADLLDKSVMNLVLNADLTIDEVNTTFSSFIGIDKTEVKGTNFNTLVLKHEAEQLLTDMTNNIKEKGYYSIDLLIKSGKGPKWVEATFTGLVSDDVVGKIFIVLIDISE